MSGEYWDCPQLGEQGEAEAQALIDSFKQRLASAAEETIGELYCNMAFFIESDSWENFRSRVIDQIRNYSDMRISSAYDARMVRKAILRHHRDEIIEDLNQDLLKEIREKDELIAKLEANQRAPF